MTKPFFSPLPSYPNRDNADGRTVPSIAQLAEAEIQALRAMRKPGLNIMVKSAPINLDLAVQIFSSFRGEAMAVEDFATAVVGLSELPDQDPTALSTPDEDVAAVAHMLEGQGKVSEAEALLRQSVNSLRGKAGRYDAQTLRAQTELAQILQHENKTTEARRLFLQTVEAQREVLGTHHVDTLETLEHLAMLLVEQNDLAHAEPLLNEVVLVRHRLHGDAHVDSLRSIRHLAQLMLVKGEALTAENLLRKVLVHQRALLGEQHLDTLETQSALGEALRQSQRFDEALVLQRQTLVDRTALLGTAHMSTLQTKLALGLCLLSEGQVAEAAKCFKHVLDVACRALPKTHAFLADIEHNYGRSLKAQGLFERAERHLIAGYDKMRASRGLVDTRTQAALADLIALYVAWGKPDKAVSYRAANATCS